MLDSEFMPKLGDFGVAKAKEHQKAMTTNDIYRVGTRGYMAPEAALLGRNDVKTDVHAFGVLVLETACGKRALDFRQAVKQWILVDWVLGCLRQGNLLSAADSRFRGAYNESEMRGILQLGLYCTNVELGACPSMRHIIDYMFWDASIDFNVEGINPDLSQAPFRTV
ncbi:hypothetical protein Mapa_005482 [Marchantia paleacea]|nr:hypothetical protein Mapa_005482 [Marchantia paleacea]